MDEFVVPMNVPIMYAVKVFNRLNTAETVYSRICDLLIWILKGDLEK